MDHRDFIGRVSDATTRDLVERGKIIEAGWAAYRALAYPHPLSPEELKRLKMAFMAGSQHIWGSIFSSLDPGLRETDGDMRRLDKISIEIDFWRSVLEASMQPAKGSA